MNLRGQWVILDSIIYLAVISFFFRFWVLLHTYFRSRYLSELSTTFDYNADLYASRQNRMKYVYPVPITMKNEV